LNPRRSVLLLEGARRPGAKILVSGGSRCNVTNAVVSEKDFWGGKRTIIRRVLRSLPVAETVAFFEALGVPLHEEPDGKLFPDSNRSRDVLDALLRAAADAGATLVAGCRVRSIDREPPGFVVTTSRGVVHARRVALATGGRSLPKSGSDGAGYGFAAALGHRIVETTPALAPLVLIAPDREWSGISHAAEIAIWTGGALRIRVAGAVVWTHFGISGPAALNASRHWERAVVDGLKPVATLSFAPASSFGAVEARITALARSRPAVSIRAAIASFVPDAIALGILARHGIERALRLDQLSREDRRRMVHALIEWPLPVAGTRGYTYAEATAGGVTLDEIDPATLQSRVCPGLYLVGEILDVDGRLGGFNFQWAWASARTAAQALALGS
jgi:predicted Rossmann fold flavoprotein